MPLAAGGTTLLLSGLFWAPLGAERPQAAAPASLAGRTLFFERAPAVPASPTLSTPLPEAAPAPLPPAPEQFRPVRKHGLRHRAPLKESAPKPVIADPPKAIAAPEPAAASTMTAAAPAAQASVQDLAERFENDPSRYPLDRSIKKDGITLSLEGVARLDKSYVLKVSVTNETSADFFIKDFSVLAGSVLLASRSDFRILVEPQRQRSGYVVFEKPRSGISVHIKLKEDGGKSRVVETLVPYPF